MRQKFMQQTGVCNKKMAITAKVLVASRNRQKIVPLLINSYFKRELTNASALYS
jgi:hypothetical protein